jgi:hypothetical protein
MSEAIFVVLGLAVAAIGIWLSVRIINRRERWAIWTAVVMIALLAYPMSVGPVLWMDFHGLTPAWTQDVPIYWPVQWMREHGPRPIREAINRYLAFWVK